MKFKIEAKLAAGRNAVFIPTHCAFKKSILATLLILPLVAEAAAPVVVPDTGAILQQIKPALPPIPSSTGTGLSIERAGGEKLPPSAPFMVKAIRITGNKQFDTATLHALVADAEGKDFTLSQLDELAAKLTAYYQAHGYPLARAIIPAQTIKDGVVEIHIIEASYGKIKLNNKSRVKDSLPEATLAPLQSGQVISQAEMDHALLLLSDIPGIAVNATLKPGEVVGTSDFVVDTTESTAMSANLALDNYGNRYTGRARAGGTLNLINPLHHGDVLSLSGLTTGSGMNYGRASYDTLLNGSGTHAGGSLSSLHYILGDTLANLNGHGTAQVASLFVKQPLVRSRELNIYGQIQYDWMQLKDHLDASSIRTDRHLDNWTGTLSGDLRNANAINTGSIGLTSGSLGFDDNAAQLADAAGAKTRGQFSKWNVNLSRMQGLSQKNSLYVALSGQWANTNLDSSQKMTAGGPYTVRAYDMGTVSGDIGYLGSVEFRRDLGQAMNGAWQAVAFVDSEHVIVNRNALSVTNSATLSGTGLGLNWSGPSLWSAKTYVAKRLGSTPALVASAASVRAWIEIGKGF